MRTLDRLRSLFRPKADPVKEAIEYVRSRRALPVGGAIGQATKKIREAGSSFLLDPSEDAGYRGAYGSWREVDQATWVTLMRRAEHLSQFNGMANRGLGIRTDLVWGSGWRPIAGCSPEYRDAVQAVLDRHWEYNDWPRRGRERIFNLGLHGESVRIIRGDSRPAKLASGEEYVSNEFIAGQQHPLDVESVCLDSWNIEQPVRVKFRSGLELKDENGPWGQDFEVLRRVRVGEDRGNLRGECVYVRVNNLLGTSRGMSDLVPAQEWMDLYQILLLTGAERAQLLMSFVWMITMENASEEELRAKAEEFKLFPPSPGEYVVTDGREKWESTKPSIEGGDLAEVCKLVFDYGWGSIGLPEHYFTQASTVNRASASEMRDPVFAWARARRDLVIDDMVGIELEAALVREKRYGSLLKDVPEEEFIFEIVTRDPEPERYELVAATLNQLAQAMTVASLNGDLSPDQTKHIMLRALEEMGVEIPEEEIDDPESPAEIENTTDRVMALLDRRRDELRDRPLENEHRLLAGHGRLSS